MSWRQTGPGRVIQYNSPNGVLLGLYNFDIDWPKVKPEHKEWLRAKVTPVLAGGRVIIQGQTSRTGSRGHNDGLAARRADDVLQFLRGQTGRAFRCDVRPGGGRSADCEARSVGEQAAEHYGEPDDRENDWWRSVIVLAIPLGASHWRPGGGGGGGSGGGGSGRGSSDGGGGGDPGRRGQGGQGGGGGQVPPPPLPTPPLLPCEYYDFEIRFNSGLRTAWALSINDIMRGPLQSSSGDGVELLVYVKPDRSQFLLAMSLQQFTHGQAQRLYDWYQGEPLPMGPHAFLHDVGRRIDRLRGERRQGCTGTHYDPPQLSQETTPHRGFSPALPSRDPGGRLY
jgi:hypothetical protein